MPMDRIRDWLRENRITEVECLVPDMTGNARGKFIPADKFIKEDSRLPESILVQTVTGDYTDIHDELVGPTDRDMMLQPDPDTMRLVPWAADPTGQIIHDCYTREGDLHPLASRNVLKRVLKLYEAEGWKPVVAPEVEYYLIQKNIDPDGELEPPIGRSGRREAGRQSYSIDAVNEFEPIVEEMYDFCEAQELDVDTLIHESGLAQMEINFLHGDALNLADQVFVFKRTMRETALRHGIYATFMAKPMEHEPGSALHIHQSIVDIKNGNNIFSTEDGGEHERFQHFIGGLQHYTPGAIAFFAPSVNSYRRFTPDIAAPINLHWGYENRTTGIRIPDGDRHSRRVENRFPGADANPYLAIAVSLACGYLGMKQKLDATEPHEGDAFLEPIAVARSLEQALGLLEDDTDLTNALGAHFVKAYCAVKREEFEAFNKVISSWEREYLLLNV
ncbi:MAG: glutamine synthetase family protein [Xanthomonadales bacterium]|nr:glutamine synthetase family protein [Xanthomonadales bacterium]MDH3939863.1 glutamine synthetase family protein [Xanthomonadales bacterium]MDH3999709.1 glutamine synthetase family protein [Xanthomonadales bacterium]